MCLCATPNWRYDAENGHNIGGGGGRQVSFALRSHFAKFIACRSAAHTVQVRGEVERGCKLGRGPLLTIAASRLRPNTRGIRIMRMMMAETKRGQTSVPY